MISLLLYAIYGAALYYIVIRAKITGFLWSRYPAWLSNFLDCAACTGFWYGILLSFTRGHDETLSVLGQSYDGVEKAILVGFSTIVLQPIIVGLMAWGLHWNGAIAPNEENQA